MLIKASTLFLTLMLAGCATHLTEAGRSIKVVRDAAAPAVADCAQLGPVLGRAGSFLSSGEYGVIYATIDARNRAALLTGADTLVITGNEGRRLGGEVTGIAYDCSKRRVAPSAKAFSPELPRELAKGRSIKPVAVLPYDDVFAKAKKCQTKGGVWVNDRCVIPID